MQKVLNPMTRHGIAQLIRSRILFIMLFLCAAFGASATTFPVTNTNDAGSGSLRQAIIDVNAAGAGPHNIIFNVYGQITILSSLPQITKSNVTIDGQNKITLNSNGTDPIINPFDIKANNVTIRNFNLTNNGDIDVIIRANTTGVTVEGISTSSTTGNYLNAGVYVEGASTNLTLRKITITDIQSCGGSYYGRAFLFLGGTQTNLVMDSITVNSQGNARGCEGVAFRDASVNGLTFTNSNISGVQNAIILDNTGGPVETANNVLLNNITIDSTWSGVALGIYSDFVTTNFQIKNTVVDLNVVTSTDDGDYGIRFDNTTNGVTFDTVTVKDCDSYSVWFNGAAQNITINHTKVSDPTPGAGYNGQFMRFEGTANTITIKNTLLDADKQGTTDDADYGLLFIGATNGVTIDSLTVNEFDVDGGYLVAANTNFQITNSKFTNNYDGIEFYNAVPRTNVDIINSSFSGSTRSGIVVNAGNATADIDLTGDTVFNNANNGIWLYGGTPPTDMTISGCVVHDNGGVGIYNDDPDKVIYTNNSIYNNTSLGIDNVSGNCSYQGTTYTPTLVSSTSLGGGQYQLQLNMPAICAAGCTVELFANDPGTTATSGQYYVTTFTGVLNGASTKTFTYNTGPGASGIGFWTATLLIPSNSCGTSEFGNAIPIGIKGPACINNGIVAWYRADQGVRGTTWGDISGNGNNMIGYGDPDDTTGLVNFNKAIYYDGNDDHRAPATAAVTTAYTMMGLGKLEGTQNSRVFTSTTGNKLFGWWGGYQDKLYVEGWINNNTNPLTNYTRLYSLKRTNTGSGPYEFKGNGVLLNSGVASNGTAWTLDVGSVNGSEYSKVFVPEVFIYNRDLTPAEIQRLESYMALKYGITLNNGATDYIASDATTLMWSASVNTGYTKRITGIGKDDCTLLHQKQSLSADTGIVTIALGNTIAVSNAANANTVTTDKTFLVFGDNNGSIKFATAVSGTNVTQRMARVWKVQKSAGWSDQNITLKINATGSNNYLLISTDPAFATISQELQLSANGSVTLNSSLLASGAYFTVGANIKGPGNVNAGVALWLRADDGSASGATWNDFSGNGNGAVQGVAASQAAVLSSSVNFNPALKFDGSNDFLRSPSLFTGTGVNNVQVYAVTITDAVQAQSIFGELVSNGQQVLAHLPWSDGILYWDAPYGYRAQAAWGGTLGAPYLWSFLRSPSTMSGNRNRIAVATYTAAMGNIAGSNSPFNVGANSTGGYFNGKIAEMIVYNNSAATTNTQRQQIESYLALKYGITFNIAAPVDYLASDGTTKSWNATVNSGYNRHITGISRDDITALNQKQSLSVDTGFVTLALGNSIASSNAANAGTITNDKSFFVFGDNGAAMAFSTAVTGITGVNIALARVWKVQKTNWADQNITLRIDSAQAIPQFLLISSDATFGTGDIALPIVNGKLTLNTSQFTDGSFFTFANALKAPGGVTSGIAAWWRADYSPSASSWKDYSGNGKTLAQTTVANQPAVLPVNINFQPAVKFHSTAWYLSPSLFGTASTNNIAVFSVSAADGAGGNATGSGLFSEYVSNGDRIAAWAPYGNGYVYWYPPAGWSVQSSTALVAYANPRYNLYSFTKTPSQLNIYFNSTNVGTANGTYTGINGNNQPFYLGAYNGPDWFNGRITEFVVYNNSSAMTATDRQKIQSYLALKYGITLSPGAPVDYLASDGTAMWTASANSGYAKRITGIGRDDTDSLYQKQSLSIDTGIVTIAVGTLAASNVANTGTINNDKSFFVFADDGGSANFATPVSGMPGITNRMTRIFKVDKTANWADQNITLKLNGGNAQTYLLVSTDAVFDGSDAKYAMNADSTITLNSSNLADGVYFTFAKNIKGPNGINAGLNFWLRADDGSATGASWKDYAGYGHQALQATVTSQAVTDAKAINFNYGLKFDGTDDFLDINTTRVDPDNASIFVAGSGSGFAAVRDLVGSGAVGSAQGMEFRLTNASGGLNWLENAASVVGVAGVKTYVDNRPYLFSATQNNLANGIKLYQNFGLDAQGTVGLSPLTANLVSIGSRTIAARGLYWLGNISEVIVYNRVVTDAERQSVESYLALKYGITLNNGATSYLSSNGTVYWTADATYKSRVTGIGRDDSTALNTKQSLSADTGFVTLSLGTGVPITNETNSNTITNDRSFFAFADNGLSASNFTVSVTGSAHNVTRRMARVWKVQKTNWTDQNITFKIKPIGIDNYLLISSDPTFATFSQEIPVATDGTITFSSSLFTGTNIYYTFGAPLKSPGGVSGHTLWVRADIGTSAAAGNMPISQWSDMSAFSNTLTQGTPANQPTFYDDTTNNINFNPVVRFNGSTSGMTGASMLKTATYNAAATFVVNSQVAPTNSVVWTEPVGVGTQLTLHATWGDNVVYWDPPYTSNRLTYNAGNIINQSILWTATSDISLATNRQTISKNGVNVSNGNNTSQYTGNNSTFQLGWNAGAYNYNGRIAEVIIYTSALTPVQQQRVNSYLAVKYGITLNNGLTDYLATDGTTKFWDATANATYKNNIAGIGRDDEEALEQKQSRSINAGTQVTIGLGSIDSTNSANVNNFTADKSYLVWGDDNGALSFRTAVTGTALLNYRMTRVWKVQETGTVGTVRIAIPAAALANRVSSYIIVSNDAVFDGSDAITKMDSIRINNTLYYSATADLTNGQYFTFACDLKIPGGVVGNTLWLRADYGTSSAVDGTAINEWDDFGADINHATQPTAANQPLYTNNISTNINFNPVVKFNGTSQRMLLDGTKLPVGTIAKTVIAATGSAATASRGLISWGDQNAAGTGTRYTMEIGGGQRSIEVSNSRYGNTGGNTMVPGITMFTNAASTTSAATQMRVNGAAVANALICCGTQTLNTLSLATAYLGDNLVGGGGAYYNGLLGEVVVYDKTLTAVEQQRVESYLALKNGITLNNGLTSYLATDGTTTVWDATGNAVYKYSVTGIGRDDLEGLTQKQSRNIDTTRLRIAIGLSTLAETNIDNTASFAADKSYLIWGDDNAAVSFKTTVTGNPNVNYRMTRVWTVQETGTVGTVEIAVPYDVLPNPKQTYLVVSNDNVFDGTDTYTPLYPITLNGKRHWAAQADLTNGQYFTFAAFIKSPGGVGMTSLWLRPDNGIVNNTDGSPVDTWVDFGNEVNTATQTTAANQPVFQNNATGNINYNPVVKFDGTADFMNLDISKLPMGTATRTLVGVGSLNSITGNRYIIGWGSAGTNLGSGLASVSGNGTGVLLGYANDISTTTGFWGLNTVNELFGTWAGGGGQANLYSKMTTVATPVAKPWNTTAGTARIGNSPWGTEYWSGPIGEVIVFDRVLSNNERERVSTYLSIRHGYTMDQTTPYSDYLNTSSTVIWNAAANASYKNNIAGIGRDDIEGLYQKQSRSIQPASIVSVGLGAIASDNPSNSNTFLNDLSYLVWGSNSTALTTMNADLPAGYCYSQRLTQEWKTSLSNFDNSIQPVAMVFDLNGVTYSGTAASDFVLLIDQDGDGDFTTGTIQQIPASSYNSGTKTVNVDNITTLQQGAVFTLVTKGPDATTAVLAAYGSATASSNMCGNNGWILFKDPSDVNKYIAAIYDPNGWIDRTKINISVDVTSAFAGLGQGNSAQASRLMRRMLQVNCSSCFDAVAHPAPNFTVRMFYSPTEKSDAESVETNNLESIKTTNMIVGPNLYNWFKAEGTAAQVVSSISPAGIGIANQQWNDGNLGTGTVDGVDYVDFIGINGFSTFGGMWSVTNVVPLPLHFLSFNAAKAGDAVALSWKVTDEQSVKGYYVERSLNGTDWTRIGYVPALPAAMTNNYAFTDEQPANGNNYYRIAEQDYDGRSLYSIIRLVTFGKKNFAAFVYPVPVHNTLSVNIQAGINEKAQLRILDATGRLLHVETVHLRQEGNLEQLDLSAYKAGVYFVELLGNTTKWTSKFIKD